MNNTEDLDKTDAWTYMRNYVSGSITNVGTEDTKVVQRTEAAIVAVFQHCVYGNRTGHFLYTTSGLLRVFNGKFFETCTERQFEGKIKMILEENNVGEVYQINSHSKIMRELLLGMETMDDSQFGSDREYAVFNNLVLELRTGQTFGFSTRFKTDIIFDFDYEPSMRSPLWAAFLDRTIPNPEMQKALQMFCGALMTDRERYKIEYVLYLIGRGQNGKSVVTKAVAQMFSKNLVSQYSPQQLFTSSSAMFNRAEVDGKLANFCDDVKASDFSGGDFKQFVSGGVFPARFPHQRRGWMMRRVPFMICCVNEMPPTTDDTYGHYRRILPILCPNIISESEKDTQLSFKLSSTESRQAIFNWVYKGYLEVVKNDGKIEIGESIREAREEIMADGNSARRWIRDMRLRGVENPVKDANDTRWKPLNEWMTEYIKYCEDMSESPKSAKSVGRIFTDMGFPSWKRSKHVWYCLEYEKIELTDADPYKDEEDLPF